MWPRLNRWLNNVPLNLAIQRRQAPFIQVMLLVSSIGASVALPLFAFSALDALHKLIVVAATTEVMALLFTSILLIRRGHYHSAVTLTICSLIAGMTLGLISTGLAGGGGAMFAFSIPVTFAGLLLDRRRLLLTSMSIIVIIFCLFAAEPFLQPLMHFAALEDPQTAIGLYVVACLVLTIFIDYFATSLHQALQAALDREQELEQLRAALEGMVTERTQALQAALRGGELREEVLARTFSELSDSEARQRAILDAIPDAIYRLNREGVCLDYKPERTDSMVFGDANIVGQRPENVMPEHIVRMLSDAAARLFSTGIPQILEYQSIVGSTVRHRELRMVACGADEVLSIVRDITDRKAVDRLKSEFLAVVSHELRTPLTSIRGAIGLIAGGVTGPVEPRAQELLKIAHSNSERLLRLINDILDIEKIESGQMTFDLHPHGLRPLIERSVVDNQSYGAQFGVTLELAPMPEITVCVDADRMLQVMANLISNAVKFSPCGDVVSISLCQHDAWVQIAVTDHGSGIPEAFRSRIFQKFAQADSSDARQKGGTGLGLSITRAIVERCGGTITFASEPGAGTTFYVELPVCEQVPLSSGHGAGS